MEEITPDVIYRARAAALDMFTRNGYEIVYADKYEIDEPIIATKAGAIYASIVEVVSVEGAAIPQKPLSDEQLSELQMEFIAIAQENSNIPINCEIRFCSVRLSIFNGDKALVQLMVQKGGSQDD